METKKKNIVSDNDNDNTSVMASLLAEIFPLRHHLPDGLLRMVASFDSQVIMKKRISDKQVETAKKILSILHRDNRDVGRWFADRQPSNKSFDWSYVFQETPGARKDDQR